MKKEQNPVKVRDFIMEHHVPQFLAYKNSSNEFAIGYGHTINVYNGKECTRDEASRWLDEDIRAMRLALTRQIRLPLAVNEYQFIALMSLSLDLGIEGLLRTDILTYIKDGNFDAAAENFLAHAKQGRVVNMVKYARRCAERELFKRGNKL